MKKYLFREPRVKAPHTSWRKILPFCLFQCVFLFITLTACGNKEVSLPRESTVETYAGIVASCFTEGSGADLAHVIKLTTEEGKTVYLTLLDSTQYEGGNNISVGDCVEVHCGSDPNSEYHPIFSVKIKESNDSEPPALTVVSGDVSVKALLPAFSWSTGTSDVIACGNHPLAYQELYTPLVTTQRTAALRFAKGSDCTLRARCWSDANWSEISKDGEEVIVTGNEIELKPGGYIYEVTVQWDSQRNASYCFYIVAE